MNPWVSVPDAGGAKKNKNAVNMSFLHGLSSCLLSSLHTFLCCLFSDLAFTRGKGRGGCELSDANFCWESLVASRCIYASILVNETDSG